MHSETEVAEVLRLRAEHGFGARRIARVTGISTWTVRDWLAGAVPVHNRTALRCAVCAAEGRPDLPPAYAYLLGLYLGDGCLSHHHRGVYRLRITLDLKYPGIIASARDATTEVRGRPAHVQRRRDGCADVSSWWKHWPCLFPQHGVGSKHHRPIELTTWQLELVSQSPAQLLRGLIQSDGCRYQNTGRCNWSWPRYMFTNHSSDIRSIFCRACEQMGLRWTAAGKYTIYVSRKADVATLDRYIGPKR